MIRNDQLDNRGFITMIMGMLQFCFMTQSRVFVRSIFWSLRDDSGRTGVLGPFGPMLGQAYNVPVLALYWAYGEARWAMLSAQIWQFSRF